jgi:ribonuclease HI
MNIIFTDGSSRGNPGPGGWGAIVVEDGNVLEIGGREKLTTNNRMEILASIEALKKIKSTKDSITIYTDSSYLINGITKWLSGWKMNGWKTKAKVDVVNRDLWETLDALVVDKDIKWMYVGGHVGISGNERCDVIATSFADDDSIILYNGPIKNYHYNILDISASNSLVDKKSGLKKGGKAYSYLSMVDGLIMKHQSWLECESRVKGKSGAKFKKSFSESDERDIIESWSKE